ncbi:MAG TPA: hypothetical protein VKU41_15790 [Polyangiaceae bacterium]|nr:hypothetical protein [Polyangiaceae bacterium]
MHHRFVLGVVCSAWLATPGCASPPAPSPEANAASPEVDAAASSGRGTAGTAASPQPDASSSSRSSGARGADAGDGAVLGGWAPTDAGDASEMDAEAGSLSVQTVQASVGPIPVDAGEETVVCVTMRLSNAEAVYVPRITVQLAPGSHHLVVYRSMATAESPPTPCTTFQGILTGSAAPLMISEKASDDLTFPQGVAVKLAAQQMIELEAHYINTGATALQGHGAVEFETIPATTPNVVESDFALFTTTNITLPAGVTTTVGPLFVAGKAGTHAFALTTHQHRLGTEFKVWAANSATDTNHPPIADTLDWSNPPLYRLDPVLDFGGQNGLAYQCTWDNTTGQLVTFGEGALQEMCVLWMYYYPSHGLDLRFQ